MSSQPIGDKIHEVHEELVKAAGRHGEDARTPSARLSPTLTPRRSTSRPSSATDDAKRKVQAQHDIARLEEMATPEKKTLDASGEEFPQASRPSARRGQERARREKNVDPYAVARSSEPPK